MGSKRKEVAFVTGAGSGIGRATARRLSRRGASVGLMDINSGAAAGVGEEIEAEGGRCLVLAGDVRIEADVAGAVAATVDAFGGLDTAVTCAGIEGPGNVVDVSIADWERVLAVNLTGTFLTARSTIPHLIARGGGSFVALSSRAGITAGTNLVPYCTSKFAVVGLVRCLALDHGRQGVRCNCICPTFVETPMADRILQSYSSERRSASRNRIPLGRFAKPEEVADVIAHLTSKEGAFANGLLYVLDGGETAGLYSAPPADLG